MRILLIEDDIATAKSVELMLKSEDCVCNSMDLGEDGLDIGKLYDYDLVILDLMLPDIDGLEVLRRMRAAKVQTPVLILSGISRFDEKVKALTAGADDYLTKPFNKEELVARIQAIVRRYNGHFDTIVGTRGLSINLDNATVSVNGQPIYLTRREYSILELFAIRKGSTLTKEMILSHLYGGMDEPEIKLVDVFVCNLRSKLASVSGENYLETIGGRGYQMPALESNEVGNRGTTSSQTTDQVLGTVVCND